MTVRVSMIGAGIMGADHVNTLHRPAPLPTAWDGLIADVVAEAVIASMRSGGKPSRVRELAA